MSKPNPLREKSYGFSVKLVRFCRHTRKTTKEFALTDQLLRSGTSIGANVEEALQAQSKNDFIAKLSISLKEAHESHYWLRLFIDTDVTDATQTSPLLKDADELVRLLTSILKTSRSR